MGGYEGQKKFVCLKWMGLSFLALYSKFHFCPEENIFVLGWAGLAGGGSSRPPPPVAEHIPGAGIGICHCP